MSEARWPKAEVRLVGEDGNAFSILGRAGIAIRRAYGANAEQEYLDEAMSGDYNHLLAFTLTNTTQPNDYYDYDDDEYDEDDEDWDDPWDDESNYNEDEDD